MIKWNNNLIDIELINKNRNIIRLDDFKNVDTKMLWQCLICNYIWSTTSYSVINANTGCSCCSNILSGLKNRKTNNYIDDILIKNNKNIKRISNFKTMKDLVDFKCLNCNYIWTVKPTNIIYSNTGCPNCANNIKLTNEYVDKILFETKRDIIRIDNYISCHSKINWQCLLCLNIWSASYSKIILSKQGCPKCKSSLGEKATRNILNKLQINFVEQYVVQINKINCRIDFYIESLNLFIEYNGLQHYKPIFYNACIKKFKKQVRRDKNLRKYCKNNNINLFEIDSRKYFEYLNFKNFQDILEKNIVQYLELMLLTNILKWLQ